MNDRDLIFSRISGTGSLSSGRGAAELFVKGTREKDHAPGRSRESLIRQFEKESGKLSVKVSVARNPEELETRISSIVREAGVKTVVKREDAVLAGMDIENVLKEIGVTCRRAGVKRDQDETARKDFLKYAGEAHMGICGADFALADTGTLVIRSGPGLDRSSSLLPYVFVALLKAENILSGMEEFLPMLQKDFEDRGRLESCTTFITGPSKTADIEMILVHGVHGPGEVHVVILDVQE